MQSVDWRTGTPEPTFEWESPTRTGSLQPIPLEIYDEIFSHLKPSLDDAFSRKEHRQCFFSIARVCRYFAAVARPVIWDSMTFSVNVLMRTGSTGFATEVAQEKALGARLAGLVKKCKIEGIPDFGNFDQFMEEDGFGDVVAAALARMPVEELTITWVVITKRVLQLVKAIAPGLKVLKIDESCCMSDKVSDDELRAVFGVMRLEELKITGPFAPYRLLLRSPSIIRVSSLRRLYTDALFIIDNCIAQGADLIHLELEGMHVLWENTHFLYPSLQAFPSLTHISIHADVKTRFGQIPRDIPLDVLPNLISFKAPPGLLPKFFGLGPKIQVLDSTGTNRPRPHPNSSHPILDPSSAEFTATNIRELVVFDCNLNSQWVVPPVNKPVPNLKVMRVIYTGTVDQWSVPRMFEEIGTMCEARTTRFPVEELVITFDEWYFPCNVGNGLCDCSWAVDLTQQLKMIEGLADGLPKLKRVLFHGGFVAWVKDEDDGDQWKPRMLNQMIFRMVKRLLADVRAVDYMACLEPFL